MLNVVTVIQFVQCVHVCSNTLDVLQLHSIFLYMYYKDFLSGNIGSLSSYIHKMERFLWSEDFSF